MSQKSFIIDSIRPRSMDLSEQQARKILTVPAGARRKKKQQLRCFSVPIAHEGSDEHANTVYLDKRSARLAAWLAGQSSRGFS